VGHYATSIGKNVIPNGPSSIYGICREEEEKSERLYYQGRKGTEKVPTIQSTDECDLQPRNVCTALADTQGGGTKGKGGKRGYA